MNIPPPGAVESHAYLLRIPPAEQLLYKVMSVENLLKSLVNKYLHFNRVDSYTDFPEADPNDGSQLPGDKPGNASMTFAKASDFSAAEYYDQSRARTYACSFSTEDTDYIWSHYGNGCEKGKVCLVFELGKLRTFLNQNLEGASLLYEGNVCRQIFSVNYGLVDYVEWKAQPTRRCWFTLSAQAINGLTNSTSS